MKYRAILASVCLALPFGCNSGGGGSNTSWATCTTDAECHGAEHCIAGRCVAAGGASTGGHANSGTGGATDAGNSTGGKSSTDAGGRDGSAAGSADSGPADGSAPESGPVESSTGDAACSPPGSWSSADSVAGSGYSDLGLYGEPPRTVAVAGDGSAFVAWSAHDPTGTHVYAHVSRYAPSGGWTPYLQFDEYEGNGAYGGSTPAVAASDNGEAMVVWRHGTALDGGSISYKLMAMRYASGWQTPVVLRGPISQSPAGYTIGADAQGNFVVAWGEVSSLPPYDVRMIRYARGSGWGSVESPPPTDTDAGVRLSPWAVGVSVAPNGNALVTWSAQAGLYGPTSVQVERFVPGAGWSGKEILAGPQFNQPISGAQGAIGNDGSAAVSWDQDGLPYVAHFSGSWSTSASVDGAVVSSGMYYGAPAIATDFNGTFMVAWGEQDQAYASHISGSGAWSPRTLLNVPAGTTDAGVSTHQELSLQVAMNAVGDAVVTWNEYDQGPRTDSVDVVTYTPSAGFTPSVRLDTNSRDVAPPLIDACGNATLTWIQAGTNDARTASHAVGAAWTVPLRLGTVPSGYTKIADGLGSNGEVVASFRQQDDHGLLASVRP